MATKTTSLNFESKDFQTGLFNYNVPLLHISNLDLQNNKLGIDNVLGTAYVNASLDTDFKVNFKATIGGTTTNIDYPVYANINYQDIVDAGTFKIDTSDYKLTNAKIDGNFQFGAVGIYIDSKFDFALNGALGDSTFSYDPEVFEKEFKYLELSSTGTNVKISSSLSPLDLEVGFDEAVLEKEILGGLLKFGVSVPGNIEGESQPKSADTLAFITAKGKSDNALISAQLSISKMVEYLYGIKESEPKRGLEFYAAIFSCSLSTIIP